MKLQAIKMLKYIAFLPTKKESEHTSATAELSNKTPDERWRECGGDSNSGGGNDDDDVDKKESLNIQSSSIDLLSWHWKNASAML